MAKRRLTLELWEALLAQAAHHELEWTWVKGHAGSVDDERVDRLAVAARDGFARAMPGGR
jgi:ribonuclease HI